MSTRATASFDVTGWDPTPYDEPAEGPHLTRVAIRKAFRGDLEGESVGEGLFCGMNDPAAGAGYVVTERFTGRLGERAGTFVLQHGGLAAPGEAPHSFGHVVPGSGTGALTGLRGEVSFAEGHTLTLDYDLG
jgi:hypothetical protein